MFFDFLCLCGITSGCWRCPPFRFSIQNGENSENGENWELRELRQMHNLPILMPLRDSNNLCGICTGHKVGNKSTHYLDLRLGSDFRCKTDSSPIHISAKEMLLIEVQSVNANTHPTQRALAHFSWIYHTGPSIHWWLVSQAGGIFPQRIYHLVLEDEQLDMEVECPNANTPVARVSNCIALGAITVPFDTLPIGSPMRGHFLLNNTYCRFSFYQTIFCIRS